MQLTHLSNEEVLASLRSLIGDGRRIVAKVIAYLVEVEDRRLDLELACSSMYDFCVRKLGMSGDEAVRRIGAARTVRRFPRLLDAIESGRIHLTNLLLLRDHLTEDNVDELVAAASGKTKNEVKELITHIAPRPDVAESIRRLPDPANPNSSSVGTAQSQLSLRADSAAPQIEPLSPARYKVELTASTELRDKLERVRELMLHQNPSGDLATVVERALDVLIEKLERDKLGKAKRPRAPGESSKPAHITRAARREVVERDGWRCSFVSRDGDRCPARGFLELDHKTPRALGGTGEATNVRLLCRSHNRHAAERIFGREHVEQRIRDHTLRRACAAPVSRTPDPSAPPLVHPDVSAVRERVGAALVSMGFRPREAHLAISAIDPFTFGRPIEVLLREALGTLT